jgi:UDP:flavonoid glycosyltransferase YjiC (YdhE family)
MTNLAQRRILVATAPAAGHVNPVLPIARELVRLGHDVGWYTGRAFQGAVESVGARFEPIKTAYDPGTGTIADRFPERASLKGLKGIKFDLKHVFLDEIPSRVQDLQRLLSERPADLLVSDLGFTGAAALHELGGPKWVTIGVLPLPLPGKGLAPFGPGLPPVTSIGGRLRAGVVGTAQRIALRDVERHHHNVRATLGLPPSLRDVFTANASPYLFIQSGTEAFDYPRTDLPGQVHYVGPLLASAGGVASDPTDWVALAAGRPIVLVTQGTLATDGDDLVRPALEGLKDEDVLVVAVAAGGTPEGVPSNAVVRPFIPYDAVVPHASAVVTNGGYGGVQWALAHGVPLVVAGATEDKPEVAARVAWTGAGIDLRTGRPKPRQIRAAVRNVLDDARFARGAGIIRDDYGRHCAPTESANLVQRLLETDAPVVRGD